MKMSMYMVFLVILGGAQLHASKPTAIKSDSQTLVATESDWILVSPKAHRASKISFKQCAYQVVLQFRTAQVERLKAELAQAQAVAAKIQKTFGSVAQVYADKRLEGDRSFQNNPERYGLFPWEDASY